MQILMSLSHKLLCHILTKTSKQTKLSSGALTLNTKSFKYLFYLLKC